MDKYELYKELYYKELERRSQINNKLVPTITIIVAMCTAHIWIVARWLKDIADTLYCIDILIGITIAATSILIVHILILSWKTYCNCTYYRINPKQIIDFVNQCEQYDDWDNMETYVKHSLATMYEDAVSRSYQVCSKKSEYQVKSYNRIILTVLFLIIEYIWTII